MRIMTSHFVAQNLPVIQGHKSMASARVWTWDPPVLSQAPLLLDCAPVIHQIMWIFWSVFSDPWRVEILNSQIWILRLNNRAIYTMLQIALNITEITLVFTTFFKEELLSPLYNVTYLVQVHNSHMKMIPQSYLNRSIVYFCWGDISDWRSCMLLTDTQSQPQRHTAAGIQQ